MKRISALRRGWPLLIGLVAVILILPLAAACGDDDDDEDAAATIGDLRILDPWVRTTNNDVSAGYFRVENEGGADTLIAARASITQMVQLHEVITEGSSSKMQPKEGGFPVPADGTLELKPGGFHLMLMNLAEPLEEGDEVELELTFEKAGTVKVTAPVRPSATIEGMGGGH